jgi:aspartyl-tRNA(Asn)/glutamyl-tRNA(Gln) amidotransferase subunit A
LETVPKSADEAVRVFYSFNSPNVGYNLAGHPAVTIPIARDANGLPMGLQIAARRSGDFELLGFAARIEEKLARYGT